jgi:hypothetical protein
MLLGDTAEDGTPIEQLTSGSTRRVRLQCDMCAAESTTTWSNYLQALRVRQEQHGKTYCRPCGKKIGGIKKLGRPQPAVAAANRKRCGEKHASWRGGRYIDREGYVMLLVEGSKTSGWARYRKEHLVVMERKLHRKLRSTEVVHHIDNNKQNNQILNLYLTDGPGHRLAHVSLVLAFQLLRAAGLAPRRAAASATAAWPFFHQGLIEFDRVQGIYVANLKLRELLEHPNGTSRGQSAAKPISDNRKVQRLGHGVR